jgi:hypothetical protein
VIRAAIIHENDFKVVLTGFQNLAQPLGENIHIFLFVEERDDY